MESRLLFQNKSSKFDGMESIGRRELRHPSSTNMRYLEMVYNVEEIGKYVHEPVSVLRMAEMQSQEK